jgi:UDP-N-acetylmuramoyl-L-alanyl-D-glutamate--2,6-diaminopimelate ligase
MRLAELLGNQWIPNSHADLTVFGVTDDSREVRFGFVFCALPLSSGRGTHYCCQAAARGAQVVIVPDGTTAEAIGLSEFEKTKVLVLHHPRVQSLYAQLVARFHSGRPAILAAVTGTNGKSSTVSFLRDLWTHAGYQPRHAGAALDGRAAHQCRSLFHYVRRQVYASDHFQPGSGCFPCSSRGFQPRPRARAPGRSRI